MICLCMLFVVYMNFTCVKVLIPHELYIAMQWNPHLLSLLKVDLLLCCSLQPRCYGGSVLF